MGLRELRIPAFRLKGFRFEGLLGFRSSVWRLSGLGRHVVGVAILETSPSGASYRTLSGS